MYKDRQEYLRIRLPLRIENNAIKERYSGPSGQLAFSRCRFHSKEPCPQTICTQTSLKVISDRCALACGRPMISEVKVFGVKNLSTRFPTNNGRKSFVVEAG